MIGWVLLALVCITGALVLQEILSESLKKRKHKHKKATHATISFKEI